MGFYVAQSGNQIIPRTVGQYIVTDDHFFTWPIEDFPTGAKWSVVGYNTDIYPHTVQFHFHINEFSSVPSPFPAPLAFH